MFRPIYKHKRTYIGTIPKGADLYESLSKIIIEEDIRVGKIIAIGAVQSAIVGYFDQTVNQYKNIELLQEYEILNCTGNVSLRDGKPFLHVHITLGDKDGKVLGGHLMPGTKVFVCEVIIDEYTGEDLIREKDSMTGLFLWSRTKLV